MKKGNKLLDGEKPVGDSAARIQEQMETCQVSCHDNFACRGL